MLMYQHSRSSVSRPGHINDGGKPTLHVLIDEPDLKHSFETVSSVSMRAKKGFDAFSNSLARRACPLFPLRQCALVDVQMPRQSPSLATRDSPAPARALVRRPISSALLAEPPRRKFCFCVSRAAEALIYAPKPEYQPPSSRIRPRTWPVGLSGFAMTAA